MNAWERRTRITLTILAFVVAVATAAEAAVVTRGPYLQMGSHNRIVVRWRTDVATNSQVSYGLCHGSSSCMSWNVVDATSTKEHQITLTGLSPNTRYYYTVGTTTQVLAGNDAGHFFVTAPSVGASKPTRIWVLGDSGTGTANARAVRDAYYEFAGSGHTDLWLMLGDNAYNDGTDAEYQAGVFDAYPEMLRKSVLWPSFGNHDAISSTAGTQSGPYFDMFTLPRNAEAGGVASGTEAYYSFNYGNIHFVVLDSSESNRAPTGPMMTWLRNDLLANNQDWTIAFWHHPTYSKGNHDSDSEGISTQMRENALPILEDYGVDLVLAGHSHSYERSFLLDGHYGESNTLVPSTMILDAGDGRPNGTGAYEKPSAGPDPHRGTVYVVAGSSGKVSAVGDHPAMFTSLAVLGSLVLDVDDNRLDATFLQSTGAVGDTFTITKGGPSSAGARNPTADEAVTSSAGDGDGFQSNPTDAYVDDGVFARDTNSGSGTSTTCSSSSKDKHLFYNYNLSIPSGATVEGIEVLVDARVDSTSGSPKICAWLSWNEGSSWTSAKSTSTLKTSEDRYVLGGPTTLWGRSWTAGNLSNTNFRVRLASVASSTSRDFDLDWVGVKVTVSGGGGSVPVPDIAVTPASHNYGTQLIGTTVTQGFTVSNTGTEDLVVGPSDLTGSNASQFDFVSGENGFTIAPGASRLIEVSFSPSTEGPKNATLSIPSNDPDEHPILIPLTGAGSVSGGGGSTPPTLEETQQGGSADAGSVNTSASLLGVTGHVYLAAVSTKPHREVNAVTGLGLTWTRVAAQCAGRSQTGLDLWWAQGNATTGPVTATLESVANNAQMVVTRYSDVASTNPVSLLASGNTNGFNGGCSGGSDSNGYSFSVTTTLSNSLVFGAVTMRTKAHTPGSGYVEQIEVAQGSGADMASLALVERGVPSPTSLLLNGSFNDTVDWAIIGVELLGGTSVPVPDIDEPAGHNYGNVPVGANATRTFAISNLGGADLEVTGASLVGGQASQFAITQGGAPFTIAPGATHDIDVRFAPTSGGTKTTTLRLTSNDPDESSVDVALSGTGITAPDITVTPASQNYGTQPVGTIVTQGFTVSNTGTDDLVVGASSLTGPDAAAFAFVSGQSGFTIVPGTSSLIQVSFSPPTEGPKSATLTIPSNDPDENQVLIPLTGTGAVSGGGTTQPTLEEVRAGGAENANSVTTTTNLLGVTGHLYLATVSTRPSLPVDSVAGLGLTWTRVAAQCAGREQTGIEVWWAQGAAAAGPVTATLESTSTNALINVARYSGVDTANPVAPLVAGNTNGVSGACTGGTDSDAYSFNITTTQSNALVFGAVTMRSKTHTPGSGYAELAEVTQGTGGAMVTTALVERAVPDATSLLLNGSLSGAVDWAFIGIEVVGASAPAPDIDGLPTTHAYGDVSVGQNGSRTFAIHNVGTADLQVTATNLVGGDAAQFAITSGGAPFTVAPGGTHNLDVRFAPTSGGLKATTLRLTSDDPDEGSVDVGLNGTGITAPDIAVTPTSHNYGTHLVGSSVTHSFTVSNSGTGNLVVGPPTLTGPDAGAFAIVNGQAGFTIAPGNSSLIDVRFSPTTEGAMSATLTILSDDPDENSIIVPLTGAGNVAAPDIAVTPTSHNYGAQLVGTNVTHSFTVSNSGTGTLVVGPPTLTGPDAGAFAIVNGQAGFTIAPGNSSLIDVRFSPTTEGAMSVTLTIPSDDPDENSIVVPLTGTGTVEAPATAPTLQEVREGASESASSVTTAAALTGFSGHVYLAAVSTKPYLAVNTVTGLGLTWTRVAAQCGGRDQTGVEVWWAQGTATTGTVTATLESAPSNAVIAVARYSGAAPTNPVTPLVAGNTNGVNGACSGGADSGDYSFNVTTTESNAVVFGAVAVRNKSHTPASGYAEAVELSQGSGGAMVGIALVDRAVPAATSLLLNGSLNGDADWAVIGVQLQP